MMFSQNLLKNIQPLKRCHILSQYRYASSSTFKFSDLQIQLTTSPKPKPDDPDSVAFGHCFSDHMMEVSWSASSGWGKPQISPVHNLNLHPGAKCFHYATELFEGMKAYKTTDGRVNLFRPTENMARMLSSATRSSLPTFDGNELIECIKKLVSIEKDWVPNSNKASLYIRPTLIGTEGVLRVDAPKEALLFVLVGPVGAYYPTGLKPVSLLADPKYVRAWPGGSGNFKMGCNYAPTMFIQQEAAAKGCQQVLWLFGEEEQITEVGAMNLFMFWTNEQGEDELVTCPLNGLVLPGVTRKSLLELAKSWGEFKVSEREYTMKDLVKGLNENRVKEFFGAGTACVVCPVEKILYKSQWLDIPTMSKGAPLTMRMYNALLDIQYGRVKHEWSVPVE